MICYCNISRSHRSFFCSGHFLTKISKEKQQQTKEEKFTPTTKLVLEEIAGGNFSTKNDAYGSSGVNRSLDFPKGLPENEATLVETLSKEPSNISEQCTKEGPEDSNPPENIEDKSSKEA